MQIAMGPSCDLSSLFRKASRRECSKKYWSQNCMKKLFLQRGIEPTVFCFPGGCDNHYTIGAVVISATWNLYFWAMYYDGGIANILRLRNMKAVPTRHLECSTTRRGRLCKLQWGPVSTYQVSSGRLVGESAQRNIDPKIAWKNYFSNATLAY